MRVWALIAAVSLGMAGMGEAQYVVRESGQYRHARTGLTIVCGTVDLPAGGDWHLEHPLHAVDGLSDICISAPDEALELRKGRRTRLVEEGRKRRHGKRALQRLYWAAREHAARHEGMGPTALSELDNRHWRKPEVQSSFHYVPGVRLLQREGTNRWVNAPPHLLAFELRPAVDDGEHWVLRSDGAVRSEAIDENLLTRYGVELTPGSKPVQEQMANIPEALPYRLFALRHADADGDATLRLISGSRDGESTLSWDYGNAVAADAEVFKAWGRIRMWQMAAMDSGDGASVLTYWIAAMARQYGIQAPDRPPAPGRRRRDRGRQTTVFNVLGGRAAIRETLQMQSIGQPASSGQSSGMVPVDSLSGVEVKSHPFEEMLGGETGGQLALANCAPPDRLFAYFAKPAALLQLMDGGADFIFHGGSSFTGRSLEYGIVDRYLGRLGISEKWARGLLNSGAIQEMAVMAPDLFVVDGTDLTVVSRLKNPAIAAAALKLLGLSDLSSVVARQARHGDNAFWTQRDDLLLISTRRRELQRVLELIKRPAGSLGRSAEFRYMLSRQPVNSGTRAYFYFSDPFIRRLVGPGVKIGQLRRLQARTELEAVAAGNLLRRADGHTGPTTVEALVKQGYAPEPVRASDAVLRADGQVESPRHGTLQRLTTLLANHVLDVTEGEAKAYAAYVENYNRFWRRFFDPIGIRFDQPSEKEMDLSVFILPLVDNSLYQGIRSALIAGENEHPLPLPELDPKPVATLSFNLNEKTWLRAVDALDDMLEQMLGIGPDILDNLGPDVHIAIADADPIVNVGSGELTSLAGITGRGLNNEMFMIPMVVSMLTRPCVLMIGLDDAEAVRGKLRRMRTGSLRGRLLMDGSSGSLYRLSGRDAWHYVISIEGLLSLRFGLEVKDRYLVISNLPLSHDPEVIAWNEAEHNAAAMALNPAACIDQLPALFASASGRQRDAAMSGLGCLYAMLRSGCADVDAAVRLHRDVFGFAPLHPGRGEWQWDAGRLSSTVFGYPGNEEQPEYRATDEAFGIFRGLSGLRMSMQFEDDGLRSRCRWSMSDRHPAAGGRRLR